MEGEDEKNEKKGNDDGAYKRTCRSSGSGTDRFFDAVFPGGGEGEEPEAEYHKSYSKSRKDKKGYGQECPKGYMDAFEKSEKDREAHKEIEKGCDDPGVKKRNGKDFGENEGRKENSEENHYGQGAECVFRRRGEE